MEKSHLVPSFLVSEIYFPWKRLPGFIAAQIERIASEGFFKSIEFGCVPELEDRKRIREVCRANDIRASQWLTEILDEHDLDISSTDKVLRRRSVDMVKGQLDAAVECGATTIALISGRDPGERLRGEAYECSFESLREICGAAGDRGMSVMCEPLDRFAHKKRLIGPTSEAVALFGRVRDLYPAFGFAFDTAHAALNEEDVEEALAKAGSQVVQIHLANAVLRMDDPLYGDHHMLPGEPGFLTVSKAADILAGARDLGVGNENGIRVAVEARARSNEESQYTANYASQFLKYALDLVATRHSQTASDGSFREKKTT